MAKGGNEDILSKLLEGQKEAKLAQKKSNNDINKQFADMKVLITTKSSKFDARNN